MSDLTDDLRFRADDSDRHGWAYLPASKLHEAADALDAKDARIDALTEALRPFVEFRNHRPWIAANPDRIVVHAVDKSGVVVAITERDLNRAAAAVGEDNDRGATVNTTADRTFTIVRYHQASPGCAYEWYEQRRLRWWHRLIGIREGDRRYARW